LPILQAAHWTATSATSIGSSPTSARWRPRDNPQAVSGLDFVLLDGERASSLYAFVDNPADGRPAS